MMQWTLALAALIAPSSALLRFSCSRLVIESLDPLVDPGLNPSSHLHQVVGGNTFNATMDPSIDIGNTGTCTTCTFSEDFSNYWTAVLYFMAPNGSYTRVEQVPNAGFDGVNGGMTVYYMNDGLGDYQQKSKVTAFKQGFRMLTGNPEYRTDAQQDFRQLTYTCLQSAATRYPETRDFPQQPCPAGIMANLRFPTCWDGKNLDSPNHESHVSYPANGTFESQGPCPDTHPVRLPQLMFETVWDTTPFNDPSLWPQSGQPFYWSMGDNTGYGTHGDYVFGWKGEALQTAMDSACYVTCPTLKTQTIDEANQCTLSSVVDESIDGWVDTMPDM